MSHGVITKVATAAVVVGIVAMLCYISNLFINPPKADSKADSTEPEHVLTHEGIKVYRFWDGFRFIYFTDKGSVSQ